MMTWTLGEESFLTKIEQQCNVYTDYYNKEHLYYTRLLAAFNIPILMISAGNALAAVGLNSFIRQSYVSVINAILSASTAVMGSINLYLKLADKVANALHASTLLKRLAIKISMQLSLERSARTTDGKLFLEDCFNEFKSATESGNPVASSLINHLAYTDEGVSYSLNTLAISKKTLTHPLEPPSRIIWDYSNKVGKTVGSQLVSSSLYGPIVPGQAPPEVPLIVVDVELGVPSSSATLL